MHSGLDPSLHQFSDRVNAFLETHWQQAGQQPQAWLAALRSDRRTAPHWPEALGGRGWTARQYFMWQQACIRHSAPTGDYFSLSGVGPLLRSKQHDAVVRGWLADIGQWRSTWCLAAADLSWQAAQTPLLSGGPDHWSVSGTVSPVVSLLQADWALCTLHAPERDPQQAHALVAIALTAKGVSRRGLPGPELAALGGPSAGPLLGELQLDAVSLPESAWIAASDSEVALLSELRPFMPALDPQRTSGAALQRELADLALLRAENPDAQTDLDAHGLLQIEVSALEALEQRLLALTGEDPRSRSLSLMREQRAMALQLRITDAQIDQLGYYALPFDDPLRTHNEGPVGPPLARSKVAALLQSRGLVGADDSAGVRRAELAQVLGVSSAQTSHKDGKKP